METTATRTPPALRPWQRLAARLAAVFVLVTLAPVTVVGALVHQRQSREVEDTVGNLVSIGSAQRTKYAVRRVRRIAGRAIDVELETALPTLTNVRLRLSWPAAGRTRIHLTSVDPADAAVLDSMGGGDASSEAS